MKRVLGFFVVPSFIVALAASSAFAETEFVSTIISCTPTLAVDKLQFCDAVAYEGGYEWDCVEKNDIFGPSTQVQCAAAVAAGLELQKNFCSKSVGHKLDIQGYEVVGTGAGTQYSIVGKCFIEPEDVPTVNDEIS